MPSRRSIQQRTSSNRSILGPTPVLVSDDQRPEQSGEDVCESGPERPHDADTPGPLAHGIIASGGALDLARQCRERLFEIGGVLAGLWAGQWGQRGVVYVGKHTLKGQNETMVDVWGG